MMTFDEYEVAINSEFTLQGTITKLTGSMRLLSLSRDLGRLIVMERFYR